MLPYPSLINLIKRSLSIIALLGLLVIPITQTVWANAPSSQTDCPPGTTFDDTQKPAICIAQISPGELPQRDADNSSLQTIISAIFGIIGALALLMIVISGMRYITSGGDPQKAASARNGIIFSLVGVVIALAAQAIIIFVVKRL